MDRRPRILQRTEGRAVTTFRWGDGHADVWAILASGPLVGTAVVVNELGPTSPPELGRLHFLVTADEFA